MKPSASLKFSRAACLLPVILIVSVLCFLCYRTFFLNEPLWMAAYNGRVEEVKSLLARGANPDSWGEDGTTAIETAKQHGYPEIVKMLRQAGAKESNGK